MEKTNVMRLLDAANINYTPHTYDPEITDGQQVARLVGKSENETFKTLVTVAPSGIHYIFVIPVCGTLHLKKAAKAVSEKSIAMIPQKELLPFSGYVHGGCSPIGMKKPSQTILDETAILFDTICVSAGKRGFQIELDPTVLAAYIGADFADLIE
ncbi:MAG: Cys-tRNA(Pro) deacylase [Eubacteriales bacterium]|nr:Cys-tRNA(Pro) deacylase [Eubacteriales bacterium]